MDHTHIVTPKDLESYADRTDSQRVVPELIYWLVKASAQSMLAKLPVCRIPYGDAVNQPGWDGLVEINSAYNEFVPEGRSYWEIGCGGDPQSKATTEFTKRTTKGTKGMPPVPPEERSSAAFVFVTPRSSGSGGWTEPQQSAWLKDRYEQWHLVRIIDGVKLADWIREFPAIGKWMAMQIGLSKGLDAYITPAEHWENIQAETKSGDPPLPAEIFTVGREGACTALKNLFQGDSQKLFLFAESPQDVNDFVAGFLASLDAETARTYGNQCLFVKEEESWHSLSHRSASHVFVAHPNLSLESEGAQLQTVATKRGHSVVIPICGYWAGNQPEVIRLRSPSKSVLETTLTERGYSPVRARELAAAGAESLSALIRYLRGMGELPEYATWESARILSQANMIGKWDGKNQADQAALGVLLGKEYGEWIEIARPEVLRPGTPLIQRDDKWRIVARGEAWRALGPRVTDEDLDRLQQIALQVLGERDPAFDLPKEERYAASIHGKQLEHSSMLREGIAVSLALLGSRPEALSSCSQGKADSVVVLTVRGLLKDANWDRWASLDGLLPLLAEAAPDEFLDNVESALQNIEESPFHQVFSQEGSGGIEGRIYTSGLLWALETLAWHPDYLTRAVLVLGDLASIDPGGSWSNRPTNSLADILLPWHLQTCASMEKRKVAVETLLREQPEIGWKLLLALLPHNHGFTSGCHRPAWRDLIAPDWEEKITQGEYWEQITIYTDLAVGIAKSFTDKLEILIERLPDLPLTAHENLLTHLASNAVTNLSEHERLPLWEALDDLVRKHRKFASANWALPENLVAKIETTGDLLAPQAPEFRHHNLFSAHDSDLYDEKGNYEDQRKQLEGLRQKALQEILDAGNIEAVLEFSMTVSSPNQVGNALGSISTSSTELDILPKLLQSEDEVQKSLIGGYIWGRYQKLGWSWVDELFSLEWDIPQKTKFLELLPFVEGVWTRVEQQLGDEEKLYWQDVNVNPWVSSQGLNKATEKLILYERPNAAIHCLWRLGDEEEDFDCDLATRALLAILDTGYSERDFYQDAIIKVITKLQDCDSTDPDSLFKIEWNFLPLLGRFSSGSPKVLENRLASNPGFFCEVIGLVFRSKKEEKTDVEPTEQQRNLARLGYKLLSEWKIPPGKQPDGTFDSSMFATWLGEVKRIATETGHVDIALSQLGSVLTQVPEDADGLWINNVVAEALNAKDAETMRSGFTTELFNQRGTFTYTAGEDERKLARINREKAESLEAKGYSRFATAMREFAESYEREAKREASRDPHE
ncbi:MAG: hypothetical protein KZQ81_09220 [Candidatus Thiodiazotropha sp. (ex Rostrolucina anterorostrata)]|nr:hypothetical protein [Candidatus Thiodiazotropha sp. (ex Rostrolucina anterorostrata)]